MRLTKTQIDILKDEYDYIDSMGNVSPFDKSYMKDWKYRALSIRSMINKGIIEEEHQDDGEIFYKLTDLGISLANLLGGNNK
jgi:hypothetical protein